MTSPIRIAVLGASGYTGADLVRLALTHPRIAIAVLSANSNCMPRQMPITRGLFIAPRASKPL